MTTQADLSIARDALMDCPGFSEYIRESKAHAISSKTIDGFGCRTAQPPSEQSISPDIAATLTIQNIQNQYIQEILHREIDEGFSSTYNSLHLPIDIDTGANKGGAGKNFKVARTVQEFGMVCGGKAIKESEAYLEDVKRSHHQFSEARGATGNHCSQPPFFPAVFPCKFQQFSKPRVARIGEFQSQDNTIHKLKCSQYCAWATVQAQVSAVMQNPRQQTNPLIECPSPQQKQQASFCWSCGGRIRGYFQFCIYRGCNLRSSSAAQL